MLRGGRALVFPVYKGTYERRGEHGGIDAFRDVAIASGKDFGRVIELIDSRPDLDHGQVGFYGDSRGAFHGVILTALEPRVKASVLLGAGLPGVTLPAEIDLLNFAPRIRVPTLMVAGRSDFLTPVEWLRFRCSACSACPPSTSATRSSTAGMLPASSLT